MLKSRVMSFSSSQRSSKRYIDKLIRSKSVVAVLVLCAVSAITSPSQTFNTLVNFDSNNGASPYSSLAQGLDGNLYGTTDLFQIQNRGTVFKITPAGKLTSLYTFCTQTNCADGSGPAAELRPALNGSLYGTTAYGGNSSCIDGCGTIFKITPQGQLTTLYNFAGPDGAIPAAGLAQGTDGNFYGTTATGAKTYGTVFKITPSGTLTNLHNFLETDGSDPTGTLMQATDGNFYGTTISGGAGINYGTIFRITPEGTLTTLHAFNGTDGGNPSGGLVQGNDGRLYGTTESFGAHNHGTIFKITLGGTLTTLYDFLGFPDGALPNGGLVQATDGSFYGTTNLGGIDNYGSIFKMTPGGTLTILHSFDSTDGANPSAGLVQATDGDFYGTAVNGGANGYGTVFKLSVGLPPFVKTVPTSSKVGGVIGILGTNLTGATSVTFRGVPAGFKVASPTEIWAVVPARATSGKIQVVTPSGTLSSNAAFRVIPVISSFSPTSGPPGTTVVITGEALTGTAAVTFGSVKATSFTVNSYTQITATVPAGAQTGKIAVFTPGGPGVSATTFTVN